MTHRVLLFLMLSLAPLRAAAQVRCEVEEAPLDLAQITVSPAGVRPFALMVMGAGITAHPPMRGGPHVAQVRSGLTFSGRTDTLTYSLRRSVATAAGMVVISPTARLTRVRVRGAGVSATVSLGQGIFLIGVSLPCDALTLGAPPDPVLGGAEPEGDGTFWIPRDRRIGFQAHPGSGARVAVRASMAPGLSMARIARHDAYYRVRWSSQDGSSIVGWVHRDAVLPMPQGSFGFGATGGHGTRGCLPPGVRMAERLYRGLAQITVGASVSAERGRGRWATFSTTERVLVEHMSGDDWVRVLTVPGLVEPPVCGRVSHAWVALEDVALPPNVDELRSPHASQAQ